MLNQKKEDVFPWLEDDNDKVKSFAEKYIAGLSQQIIYEQSHAQQRIELEKHRYGDDGSNDE